MEQPAPKRARGSGGEARPADAEMEGQFPKAMLDRLQAARVVAGFSVDKVEDAVPLARALLAGGIDVIELTLRTEAGLEAVAAICEAVPEMLVGVGTILTPETAERVVAAGAAFGVAPGCNVRVIKAAQQSGLPFAPGITTPSELETAIEAGCRVRAAGFKPAIVEPAGARIHNMSSADRTFSPRREQMVKFFPAEPSGGVPYLKSMSAPYAHLGIKYFPLGGINAENMEGYLALPNVLALGGSWIVTKELVEAKDWDGITERARAVRAKLP